MIGLVSGETLTVGGGGIVGKGPPRLPATENTGMQDPFPVSRHIYAQSAEKGRVCVTLLGNLTFAWFHIEYNERL